MTWLKRHLLLAIGAVLALLLLATGTWYLLRNVTRNQDAENELNQQKQNLEKLYGQDPFPHRTNVDAAKREVARIRGMINQARQSFSPVPYQDVTGFEFKKLLDNTLDDLHKRAEKASVGLPAKTYEFSFTAQKKGLKLSPRSFPGINIQLAEIQTICHILFDSKINRLVNVRRVRLSEDDPLGAADSYLDNKTNRIDDLTGAMLSPYQFEFHCFTAELAGALEGLYKSPNGLLVKAVLVDPVPTQPGPAPPPPVVPIAAPPKGPAPAPGPGPRLRPAGGPALQPASGLETILNEKLLRVILLIEVVKPAPGK
jgi:hypothetical protein